MYIISTTDIDHEDGYPEFLEEAITQQNFNAIAEKAKEKGIPLYRLSVMEYDEKSDDYEYLGAFDQFCLGAFNKVLGGTGAEK